MKSAILYWGLPRPIIKSHPKEKSGCNAVLRELPEILWFPSNISAIAEDSDFNIGKQLGFAKAHHKIPPRRKSGRGSGLRRFRKIMGSPLTFFEQLKLATSKLVCGWGLPMPIIKLHPEEKLDVTLG